MYLAEAKAARLKVELDSDEIQIINILECVLRNVISKAGGKDSELDSGWVSMLVSNRRRRKGGPSSFSLQYGDICLRVESPKCQPLSRPEAGVQELAYQCLHLRQPCQASL
ncbi:hypothetical protein VTP01DRAFT_6220 [Rhizomucor pusillus]|uniref:uncharacterized protein n=1 Tax=Rhizomucor pusillus TaxID=4840 RepID=UPI003742AADA